MLHPDGPATPSGLQEAQRVYQEAERQLREALQQVSQAFLGDPLDKTVPPDELDFPPDQSSDSE